MKPETEAGLTEFCFRVTDALERLQAGMVVVARRLDPLEAEGVVSRDELSVLQDLAREDLKANGYRKFLESRVARVALYNGTAGQLPGVAPVATFDNLPASWQAAAGRIPPLGRETPLAPAPISPGLFN